MKTGSHFSFSIVLTLLTFLHGADVSNAAPDPLCEGLEDDLIFLFAVPGNCVEYYECLNGDKTLKSCPDGYYFNEPRQMCDFPENVDCTETTTTTPTTTTTQTTTTTPTTTTTSTTTTTLTTSTPTTTTPTTTPTTTTLSTTTIDGDPRCAGTDLSYLPHPTDCTKYIECYLGHSYEMSCPPGLWYDARTEDCLEPHLADCGKGVCDDVPEGESHAFPYPGSCILYWVCDGTSETLWMCPDGLQFDADRQTCDFPEVVHCDDSTQSPDPNTSLPPITETTLAPGQHDPRCVEPGVTYWPHPSECTKYIECYNGLGYERTCPNGLEFSDDNKSCVNPADSQCTMKLFYNF